MYLWFLDDLKTGFLKVQRVVSIVGIIVYLIYKYGIDTQVCPEGIQPWNMEKRHLLMNIQIQETLYTGQ